MTSRIDLDKRLRIDERNVYIFDDLLPIDITTNFSKDYDSIRDIMRLRFYWLNHIAKYARSWNKLALILEPYRVFYPQDIYELYTVAQLLRECGNVKFHNAGSTFTDYYNTYCYSKALNNQQYRTAYEFIVTCLENYRHSHPNEPNSYSFIGADTVFSRTKCFDPVLKSGRTKRDVDHCSLTTSNVTHFKLLMDNYCPLVPYNNEYATICEYGKHGYACLQGHSVSKRWDSSVACGWPIVSSGAKFLGGECAISPQLDALKSTLHMSQTILEKHNDFISNLSSRLSLSDERATNNYAMLLNLVNATKSINTDLHIYATDVTFLNYTLSLYNNFHLDLIHFINTHELFVRNFDDFLSTFSFGTITGTATLMRNFTSSVVDALQFLNKTLAVPTSAHFFTENVDYKHVFGNVFDMSVRVYIPYNDGPPKSQFVHRSFTSLPYRGYDGHCYLSSSHDLLCTAQNCYHFTSLDDCMFLSSHQAYYCPKYVLLGLAAAPRYRTVTCRTFSFDPVSVLYRHVYFPDSTKLSVLDCASKSISAVHNIPPGSVVEFSCGTYFKSGNLTFDFCSCTDIKAAMLYVPSYYNVDSPLKRGIYSIPLTAEVAPLLNNITLNDSAFAQANDALVAKIHNFESLSAELLSTHQTIDKYGAAIMHLSGVIDSPPWLVYACICATILSLTLIFLFHCGTGGGGTLRYATFAFMLVSSYAELPPSNVTDSSFKLICALQKYDRSYNINNTNFCYCAGSNRYTNDPTDYCAFDYFDKILHPISVFWESYGAIVTISFYVISVWFFLYMFISVRALYYQAFSRNPFATLFAKRVTFQDSLPLPTPSNKKTF